MTKPIEFTVFANIYPSSIYGYETPVVPAYNSLLDRIPLRVRVEGDKVTITQMEKPADAIPNT